ncbi:FG-GAP-like repeat-containing protein, partial [Cylindrospermopsis raciborskii]
SLSDFTRIAKLYRNTGNGFEEDTNVSLPGVGDSSVAWADYDGDGKQDFLLTGYSSDFTRIAKLYRNTGNGFEEDPNVSLPGVVGSVAWADYDGDGKQDFLLTGYSSDGRIAKLYRNTGNGFEEDPNVSLPGVGDSSVAWADYDGDGKQDFLLTGSDFTRIAKLYRNTGSGFTETLSEPNEINDVTLAVSPTIVKEDGRENLVYTFTRRGDLAQELTVTYKIDGTADAIDYISATPGEEKTIKTIKFTANSPTVKIEINPAADNLSELNETVSLTLVEGDGYTVGTTTPVTGTIENDDFPGVGDSSVAWADYDGDGNQDFLLTGYSSDFTRIAKLYRNTGNGFEEDPNVSLPGVGDSSVAWADYDGDGKQDFLLTGYSSDGRIAKLYRNTGNGFEEKTPEGLPGVVVGSVAWADYDGDGKQDFLLTGYSSDGPIAKLYRNTGNGFEENTNVSLPGVGDSSVAWSKDGKYFLLTGYSSDGRIAKLYRNTGNGFEEKTPEGLPGVGDSSVAWSKDGKYFLLTGYSSDFTPIAKLYRNTGNGFEEKTPEGLPGVGDSSVAWSKDGKYFLLTGYSSVDFAILTGSSGYIAKLYRNTGNGFEEDTNVSLPGVGDSSVAWADYDGDGKQDFLLTGYSSGFTPIAKLYRNTGNGFEEDTNIGKIDKFPGVEDSSVAWSRDGKYFLLTGFDGSNPIAKLYTSEGNGLFKEPPNVSLTGVIGGSVAWSKDGKYFLLTGWDGSRSVAKLYENTGNGFKEPPNVSLTGVYNSSVAWADYDKDGDQDFVLTGWDGSRSVAKLYENTGNGFKEPPNVSLTGVYNSSVAWSEDGEYLLLTGQSASGLVSRVYKNSVENGSRRLLVTDNPTGVENGSVAWSKDKDGEYFLLTGWDGSKPIAKLYKKNKDGKFEEDNSISLPGVSDSSVAWADYDGDGKQDFILTGLSSDGRISKLYKKNKDGKFEEDNSISLPGLALGSVNWGDYDGDGRQDLLLTGESDSGRISQVYRNTSSGDKTFFTATLSPTGLPDITLAVSKTIVEEGEKLVYTFTRTGDLTRDLTVTYDRGGTADFGDYTDIISGSAFFEEDENKVELEITTRQDQSSEGYETLELTLSQPKEYTVGTNRPVKVIIRDSGDDKPRRVPLITSIPTNMAMFPKHIKPGEELSKLSYQFLDYNSPTVRAKLDSALNLTNSVFTNFLGLYEVDDPETGAVNGFFPGDPGYAGAALSRRVKGFSIKAGGSATNITTNGVFAKNPTPEGNPSTINAVSNDVRYLAPFLIANIGSKDVNDDEIGEIIKRENSSANYQNESVAYFSFGAANPGGMSQIKHFGNGIFGFEDLPLNVSDRDFNDTVFSFG